MLDTAASSNAESFSSAQSERASAASELGVCSGPAYLDILSRIHACVCARDFALFLHCASVSLCFTCELCSCEPPLRFVLVSVCASVCVRIARRRDL